MKALYIILLILEFAVGTFILGFISIFTGWTFLFLFYVLWAVLSALIIAKLKKAESNEERRKLKRNLALVTLIPLVVGVATFVFFVVALSSVI